MDADTRLDARLWTLAAAAAAVCAPAARAIVVSDASAWSPPAGPVHVGTLLGGTGVAVGQDWVITAAHLAPSIGTIYSTGSETYAVTELRPHHSTDAVLLRLDRALPGYHGLAPRATPYEPLVLAGWGVTRGAAQTNGYSWGGPQQLTVGANRAESIGTRYGVRFDNPQSSAFVPGEANFTVGDSGGALFTIGAGGDLLLAGIAVSISGDLASTQFGDWGFAINLDNIRGWITAIVHPGEPTTSSMPPPNPGPASPAPSSGIIVLALLGAGAARRRRAA